MLFVFGKTFSLVNLVKNIVSFSKLRLIKELSTTGKMLSIC